MNTETKTYTSQTGATITETFDEETQTFILTVAE